MVKLIGVILIVTSLLSLMAGAFMEQRYSNTSITGSAISGLVNTKIDAVFQYSEATLLSYSILSLVMGFMFLFRV